MASRTTQAVVLPAIGVNGGTEQVAPVAAADLDAALKKDRVL